MPEKPQKSLFRQVADASMIGIQLVFTTFIGFAIGYGLDSAMDKWFGRKTFPLLTLIFFILGIIAGFRELLKVAFRKENESDKKGQ